MFGNRQATAAVEPAQTQEPAVTYHDEQVLRTLQAMLSLQRAEYDNRYGAHSSDKELSDRGTRI